MNVVTHVTRNLPVMYKMATAAPNCGDVVMEVDEIAAPTWAPSVDVVLRGDPLSLSRDGLFVLFPRLL